ncbi:MAG: hypothetical protein HZC28_00665 [Spirochaetes bacterium]|nr:hypothetical protein [Spirochaetota bacterium]
MTKKDAPKSRTLRTLALGVALSVSLFPAGVNMLFIGNSFTMRHELPAIVGALLEEGDAGTAVKTEIVGYGGKSLFHFWELFHSYNRLKVASFSQNQWDAEISALKDLAACEKSPAFYDDYCRTLNENAFWRSNNREMKLNWNGEKGAVRFGITTHQNWSRIADKNENIDFVVLQSWQDVTDSAETGYMKYAQMFAAVAIENGAKPVLYFTAPNSHNAAPVTNAVKKDEIINTCRIAAAGAKKMNAIVVPLPLALMLAQDSEEPVARTLTFRYKKDFHPNNTMAYLTACTFYAALTGKSPEGLKMNTVSENKLQTIHGEAITEANKGEAISSAVDPDGGSPKTVFDDETRLFLQRTAWKAVELYRSGNF